MKINEGFVLRKMGDQAVIVSVGAASKIFNGMIKINETGEFIWKHMIDGEEGQELVDAVVDHYDITEEIAREDIDRFIEILRQPGIIA